MKKTAPLMIEIPAAHVARLTKVFKYLEIPLPEMPRLLTEAATNDQAEIRSGYWTDVWVYPSRKDAERVAKRLFSDRLFSAVELKFEGRRSEEFTNPNWKPKHRTIAALEASIEKKYRGKKS